MTRSDIRQALLGMKKGAMSRAASACGVSTGHLSNWFSHKTDLSLPVAHKLVRHLQRVGIEVSLADLAEDAPPEARA